MHSDTGHQAFCHRCSAANVECTLFQSRERAPVFTPNRVKINNLVGSQQGAYL